jgi:hypothetical protein
MEDNDEISAKETIKEKQIIAFVNHETTPIQSKSSNHE